MKQAWKQLENEPQAAYVRFLMYRNLGPNRSLTKAIVTNGGKSQQVSGQWRQDCARYDWVARANAWDVHMLESIGQQTVIKFVASVDKALDRILDALDQTAPNDWPAILASIRELNRYVTPEVVAAVREYVN